MRPGDPPGGADQADLLALAQALPGLDVDAREMRIAGLQPIAVIDQDGIAGEEELAGEAYHPAGGGDDRRAGRRRDVDAHMRGARLAVEDALAAIDTADRPARRPDHRSSEIQFGPGD